MLKNVMSRLFPATYALKLRHRDGTVVSIRVRSASKPHAEAIAASVRLKYQPTTATTPATWEIDQISDYINALKGTYDP